MIAGPEGRSNGTDNEKPTNAATTALSTAEFKDALKNIPGKVIVFLDSCHSGAFAGTDLERQLKSRGVDTVVLTGISSNVGVESTARQGSGFGFAFVVVEDACSAQDADQHRFAFEKTFPRLARVRKTDEVIAALA